MRIVISSSASPDREIPRKNVLKRRAVRPRAIRPLGKRLSKAKVRRPIQRTFLQWFAESRSRFTIAPRIESRTDQAIELTFPQLTPLRVLVDSSLAISIWVQWGGRREEIGEYECVVQRVGDGYVCQLDEPKYRETYPSRESLWIKHSFEPFLEWCNNDLASARWLALYKHGEDQWCEARLLADDADSEQPDVLLPVRALQANRQSRSSKNFESPKADRRKRYVRPYHDPLGEWEKNRRIQRTFLQWFSESQSRFAIPVRIKHRTDRHIELTFPQVTPALRPVLNSYEIAIWVEWEGRCWDLIADFDCALRRIGDEYICAFELPEYQDKYPSPENLWINHVFELFLEWCNTELRAARWLALHRFGDKDDPSEPLGEDESSWAEFLVDDPDSEILPRVRNRETYSIFRLVKDAASEKAYRLLPVHLPSVNRQYPDRLLWKDIKH